MRPPRIILLVFLLPTLALAQFRPDALRRSNEPANIVRDYCRLDLAGARLKAESWERMKALTAWKRNPDWQAFTIVSQYEVVSTNQGLRSALISVKYGVLGRFEIGIGYIPDRTPETVDFTVKEGDDGWKIEQQEPLINPHISKLSALQWLQAASVAEKDAGNKAAIESALKKLQAQP